MTGPLAGVRVLDLADESAVLGTKLLADLGADVLRIEPPEGDPIRRLGPFAEGIVNPERSLSHWWFNSGKRSAVLDPATTTDREKLTELAGRADLVIETGGHGLDWPAIRAAHPALTVVSVSAFGRSGPRRDWLAPDLVTWAVSGAMYTTGLPDRPPLHANWALAHQVAGAYAAIGGLAGLYHRRATGQGLHFDFSRQEGLTSLLLTQISVYLFENGRIERRVGLENPLFIPYRTFETRDGRVTFVAVTQGQWTSLVEWMAETGDVEPWLRDPALVPLAARSAERERIHGWLEQRFREFTTDELVRESNRRRIPCASINTPQSLLRDEQLRARGFFVAVDQPILGRSVEYPGLPYHSNLGGSIRPAPRLGADSATWTTASGEPGATEPSPSAVRRPPSPVGPLAGLKVLDLTWALAGPTGTRALADLGAEVIKVEAREVGDLMRGLPPFVGGRPDPNRNSLVIRLARNRRNVCVDLKKPAGVNLVRRLAAWADLIVDNFGAGVMSRLGMGPDDLAAVKPDLIQLSLSGYGQTGPTARYPSFAPISEARGGLAYAASYRDGVVCGPSIFIGDTGAGLLLAVYALAGLERRRRTGQGAYVDLSQLEAASSLLGPALLDATVNDHSFPPLGNLLPDRPAAPHGAYPTAGEDRWIAIAVLDEDQWQSLTKVMGRPELAADPRFASAPDRLAHVDTLDALVAQWTAEQHGHALAERLQAAGVPAGVVQTAQDLLERDPQLAARGFFQTVDQPDIGPIPIDSLPLRWTDGPVPIRIPAPRIAEHNEYVLREVLGLSEEEIVELVIDEVI